MLETKIQDLLQVKFQEELFQDCFIVEISLQKNNKLQVFLDADTGLTHQKCQKLSRYLESYIDEEGWLGEKYVLEVSSPGIDKPLKLKRQYVKNIGRPVKVTLKEWGSKEGVLKSVEESKIILEEEIIVKDKKKKRKEIQEVEIPFDSIEKTVVQIVFK